MKNIEMHHKDAKVPIFVHPSQVENAKRNGWAEKKQTKKSEAK